MIWLQIWGLNLTVIIPVKSPLNIAARCEIFLVADLMAFNATPAVLAACINSGSENRNFHSIESRRNPAGNRHGQKRQFRPSLSPIPTAV